MIYRKNQAFTAIAAVAGVLYLSFALMQAYAQVEPTQTSNGQDTVSTLTRMHIANDTIVLQQGEQRTIPFNTFASVSSQYIVGNATVEGSGIYFKVVDANGRCPGMEGCIQIALYPKGTPLSFNNDDVQNVKIPIPARMHQLVIYAPSGNAGTVTFDLDIVKANAQ
jgi:hypothetical protein